MCIPMGATLFWSHAGGREATQHRDPSCTVSWGRARCKEVQPQWCSHLYIGWISMDWYGLVSGNPDRKPWIFLLNISFSCKFSLEPIHWEYESGLLWRSNESNATKMYQGICDDHDGACEGEIGLSNKPAKILWLRVPKETNPHDDSFFVWIIYLGIQ